LNNNFVEYLNELIVAKGGDRDGPAPVTYSPSNVWRDVRYIKNQLVKQAKAGSRFYRTKQHFVEPVIRALKEDGLAVWENSEGTVFQICGGI
jgi:hypothetical protein